MDGETMKRRRGSSLTDPSLNVDRQLGAAVKRIDDLGKLRLKYTNDMAELRADHQGEITKLNTERLDAIRQVDTGAVTRAAEVQAAQAATLATTQATIADTLRGQVQAAAIATASALATALLPITKAIEDLRQAQYQQQGERVQRSENTGSNRYVLATVIAAGGCMITTVMLLVGVVSLALTALWLHSIHVF